MTNLHFWRGACPAPLPLRSNVCARRLAPVGIAISALALLALASWLGGCDTGRGTAAAASPASAAAASDSHAPEAAAPARASARVDGAEARALVTAGAVLLDVRTPEEYRDGHLDGALNIPVSELEAHLAELPADRTLVVYCASGRRSARAVGLLRARGLDARDLGPMRAWN
jgi:rhodanese-related sulfurtransferase